MGLFGTDTFTKTNIFGQRATEGLQPGLFDSLRRIFATGGDPFGQALGGQVAASNAQAVAEAGGLAPGAAGQAIAADVGKRAGIAGDLLLGEAGVQGQKNLLGSAGTAANFLNALTSARPQSSFDPSTQFGDILGGISTLSQPAAIGAAVFQGRPGELADLADPSITSPVGAQGQLNRAFSSQRFSQDPFDPSNFTLF